MKFKSKIELRIKNYKFQKWYFKFQELSLEIYIFISKFVISVTYNLITLIEKWLSSLGCKICCSVERFSSVITLLSYISSLRSLNLILVFHLKLFWITIKYLSLYLLVLNLY